MDNIAISQMVTRQITRRQDAAQLQILSSMANDTTEIARAFPTLWQECEIIFNNRREEKIRKASERFTNRSRNRALYLPTMLMNVRAKADGHAKWNYDFNLQSAGILEEALRAEGLAGNEPVSCLVRNNLPAADEEAGEAPKLEEEWDIMWANAWHCSQGKLLWNWPLVKHIFKKMFPLAIDWTAYNHRLRAPLVPGGFLKGKVATVPLTDSTASCDLVERLATQAATTGVFSPEAELVSGADGSGVYDPDHPQFADLVERYGKVIFQLTVLNFKTGMFAKGIVRPEEGACEKYGIQDTGLFLDHLQVKGAHKDHHKAARKAGIITEYEDCYIGIMSAKNRKSYYYVGFEQTENMDLSKIGAAFQVTYAQTYKFEFDEEVEIRYGDSTVMGKVAAVFKSSKDKKHWVLVDTPGLTMKHRKVFLNAHGLTLKGQPMPLVMACAKSLQREALDELMSGGVEEALDRIAKDDKQIQLLRKLDKAAAQYVGDERPSIMGLPMVRNAYIDRVQARLWKINTGAGIRGEQRVVVMSNAIPRGTVVTDCVAPGERCAIWRFPTVLGCGLLELEGIEPLQSHLVDGEIIKNSIFMHPDDVLCIQGDDDGDIVGVTTDHRAVTMFRNTLDSNFYAIEPDGQKLDWETDSPEGRRYSHYDPMGAVGAYTIMRSKLLACGDKWGALAMSVMVQESIDSAKRKVRWTDYRKAADQASWKFIDGAYKLHYPGSNNFYPITNIDPGELLQEVQKWCAGRQRMHGVVINDEVRQNPIAWYYQFRDEPDGSRSRVKGRWIIDTWQPMEIASGGYKGGNLLHKLADWALAWWDEFSKVFMPANETLASVRDYIPRLMQACGKNVVMRDISQDRWEQLHEEFGFKSYGKEMHKAMKIKDSDKRNTEIAHALEGLNSSLAGANLQDLVDIWVYNNTPRWRWKSRQRSAWNYTLDATCIPQGLPEKCGPERVDKTQTGFRAVANPHSAVLQVLGIEVDGVCGFLDQKAKTADTKLQAVVNYALSKSDPYAVLTTLIFGDKLHEQQHQDDNGQGIPLHKCKECCTRLQTQMIRTIRKRRRCDQTESMSQLMTTLGQTPRTVKWHGNKQYDQGDNVYDSLPEL